MIQYQYSVNFPSKRQWNITHLLLNVIHTVYLLAKIECWIFFREVLMKLGEVKCPHVNG